MVGSEDAVKLLIYLRFYGKKLRGLPYRFAAHFRSSLDPQRHCRGQAAGSMIAIDWLGALAFEICFPRSCNFCAADL